MSISGTIAVPAEQAAVLQAAAEAAKTAKIMSSPDPAPAAPAPSNKLYAYPYTKLTGVASMLSVYTGTPIELAEGQSPPENSSPWRPPTAPDGRAVYFDGYGWFVGPDLATVKIADLQTIVFKDLADTFQSQVDALTTGYTAAERQSWGQQLADAKSLLAGGQSSALLTTLASARGVDPKVLAQKIVDKDAAYQNQYAALLAAYQKQRDAVSIATSPDQLPAISIAAFSTVRPL
jgi:hypothetical protein